MERVHLVDFLPFVERETISFDSLLLFHKSNPCGKGVNSERKVLDLQEQVLKFAFRLYSFRQQKKKMTDWAQIVSFYVKPFSYRAQCAGKQTGSQPSCSSLYKKMA